MVRISTVCLHASNYNDARNMFRNFGLLVFQESGLFIYWYTTLLSATTDQEFQAAVAKDGRARAKNNEFRPIWC